MAAGGWRGTLTRNLAIELAGDGIRVNPVVPGVVQTAIHGGFMSEYEIQEILPTSGGMHPLGRIVQIDDVVEEILFPASRRPASITADVVPVDGGVTAGRSAAA